MEDLWEHARNLRAEALGHTENNRKEYIDSFMDRAEKAILHRAAKGESGVYIYIEDQKDLFHECYLVLKKKMAPFTIELTDDGYYVRVSWM